MIQILIYVCDVEFPVCCTGKTSVPFPVVFHAFPLDFQVACTVSETRVPQFYLGLQREMKHQMATNK